MENWEPQAVQTERVDKLISGLVLSGGQREE